MQTKIKSYFNVFKLSGSQLKYKMSKGLKLGKTCRLTNTDKKPLHHLLASTKCMTILIHIGWRQNSSSSYFTSCGKIDSAFKLSERKQESECKLPMSSGAGAGVTFLRTETGAGVKKSDSDHLWCLFCCNIYFSMHQYQLVPIYLSVRS